MSIKRKANVSKFPGWIFTDHDCKQSGGRHPASRHEDFSAREHHKIDCRVLLPLRKVTDDN